MARGWESLSPTSSLVLPKKGRLVVYVHRLNFTLLLYGSNVPEVANLGGQPTSTSAGQTHLGALVALLLRLGSLARTSPLGGHGHLHLHVYGNRHFFREPSHVVDVSPLPFRHF